MRSFQKKGRPAAPRIDGGFRCLANEARVTVQTMYVTLSQYKHSLTGGSGGASEPAFGRTRSAPLGLNVYKREKGMPAKLFISAYCFFDA
jgi:hypothetical protein